VSVSLLNQPNARPPPMPLQICFAVKWIKAHWDELQFFGPEVYVMDGSDVGEKYADASFCTSLAIVKYEVTTPYFYFIRDYYKQTTF